MPKPEGNSALRQILDREARLGRSAAALSVCGALLWVAQAAVIAAVISDLMGQGGLPVAEAALALVALALLRAWAEASALQLSQRLSAAVRQDLRRRLAAHVLRLSPAGQDEDLARLSSLAGEGIAQISPWVERYRPARLRGMVVSPLILLLTLSQSWAAALALALTGPLIPVFMALVGWAAEAASRRHLVEQGALNRVLLDRIAALTDLRLLGAMDLAKGQLARQADDLRQRIMAVLRLAFLSSAVLEFFAALGVALVAVHVGLSLLGLIEWGAWGAGLSPFGGVFILLLAPDFYAPLRDLAATWHDRASAEAAALAVDRELERGDTILGSGGADDAARGVLEWSGLSVDLGRKKIAFPDGALAPGKAMALTGASGTGKTTFLRALAGLIRAEGQVSLGALVLDDTTADRFRTALSMIPQVPQFPDLTLSEWLDPAGVAGPRAVAAALQAARIDAVVDALPEGLATRLGETGAGVSGGEARRLLIARAMVARPAILLADEPTADLDPETGHAVIAGLLALRDQGTALLVATHDPAVMACMDHVLRLEVGA